MKFETKPPQNRTITVADGQRTGIFRGAVVDLGLETTRLPNGELLNLEIVRHPGGAAILALDQQNRVCLLRQYRHSIGKWIWELPAGVIEKGEQPIATAKRELREEAGLEADGRIRDAKTIAALFRATHLST